MKTPGMMTSQYDLPILHRSMFFSRPLMPATDTDCMFIGFEIEENKYIYI